MKCGRKYVSPLWRAILRKVKSSSLDMIYMINSFEFQETDGFYSLKTNYKHKSRKLEKTISLI